MALHLIYGARGIFLWLRNNVNWSSTHQDPDTEITIPVDIPDGPNMRKLLSPKIPIFELTEVYSRDSKYENFHH